MADAVADHGTAGRLDGLADPDEGLDWPRLGPDGDPPPQRPGQHGAGGTSTVLMEKMPGTSSSGG